MRLHLERLPRPLATPLVWLLLSGGLLAALALLIVGLGKTSLLIALAAALSLVSSLVAWHQRKAERLVRLPPLLIPAILLLQVLLSLEPVLNVAPALTHVVHPGICMLPVACLLVPMLALLLPVQSPPQRSGARATRQRRRAFSLVLASAGATWFALIAGSLVHGGHAGMPLFTGSLLAATTLALLTGWAAWQSGRGDNLIRGGVLAMGGVLLLADGAVLAGVVPTSSLHGLESMLLTLQWVLLVALSVLLLRRPLPVQPAAPAATRKAQAASQRKPSLLQDYISLTKPKVVSLLLVTTLAAMFLTDAGMPSLALVFWTLLGGYLASGGAGAMNCAQERDVDNNMGRTSRRPVPSGRIAPRHALLFGLVLVVLGFVVLATFATLLAAVLAVIGAFYYAVAYTRWLKRHTWHNIVIGGGAGAMPPLVGWAAVTGSLSLAPVIMFLIIFYWTPPHFWALALIKQQDYARAGIPMLPVVAGEAETRWQIWLYSVLLVFISLLPTLIGALGMLYLVLAIVLGLLFLRSARLVWQQGEQAHIWGLYTYSLLYLALLFGAMVLDKLLMG